MTILIRGGRAGSGRRDGLMMVRKRISSFDLVLYLGTLLAQDGEHGVKGCGGLLLDYWFIFTGDTVFSPLYIPF